MWFDTTKRLKKNYRVVLIPVSGEETLIAKTDNVGFARDIARFYDEKYTACGVSEFMIEVR